MNQEFKCPCPNCGNEVSGVMELPSITEADVCAWLLARLAQITGEGIPGAQVLTANASHYMSSEPDVRFHLHAITACVVSQPDIATAVVELKRELGDIPAMTAHKRAEAARLLAEAEALEKNNRPKG